jgi:hypothetical protein
MTGGELATMVERLVPKLNNMAGAARWVIGKLYLSVTCLYITAFDLGLSAYTRIRSLIYLTFIVNTQRAACSPSGETSGAVDKGCWDEISCNWASGRVL